MLRPAVPRTHWPRRGAPPPRGAGEAGRPAAQGGWEGDPLALTGPHGTRDGDGVVRWAPDGAILEVDSEPVLREELAGGDGRYLRDDLDARGCQPGAERSPTIGLVANHLAGVEPSRLRL